MVFVIHQTQLRFSQSSNPLTDALPTSSTSRLITVSQFICIQLNSFSAGPGHCNLNHKGLTSLQNLSGINIQFNISKTLKNFQEKSFFNVIFQEDSISEKVKGVPGGKLSKRHNSCRYNYPQLIHFRQFLYQLFRPPAAIHFLESETA